MERAVSELRIGKGLFFERGIEKITFESLDAIRGLPDQRDLPPAEDARRPMLDQLLAMHNLESFLEEAIRPDFMDRDLLMPVRFRQVMDDTRAGFTTAADSHRAANPQAARTLERAARLLGDEVNLRELLQMYRAALLQG